MKNDTIGDNTMQKDTIYHNTIKYDTIWYDTMQYDTFESFNEMYENAAKSVKLPH